MNLHSTLPIPDLSGNPSPAAQDGRAWAAPGIGPLTPIATDCGPFPAIALRRGDRLRLRSGRFRPIARIDRLVLDEAFLDRTPAAQPVLVQPGRLRPGLPAGPVLLAPGQVLSGGQGLAGTIRTARDLLRAGMAHRQPERFLTYVVIGFDEPEDVCAAGLWLRVEPPVAAHEAPGEEDSHGV